VLATVATAVWNGIAGTIAIGTGIAVSSVALVGFGLEAGIDAAASAVLAWRFHLAADDHGRGEHLEGLAQRGIGAAFLAAGCYIGIRSVVALAGSSHAHPSTFAIAQACVSLLVLPPLGVVKLRLATRLESRALRGDGILTTVAAALAALTLVGLVAGREWSVHWLDPLAAVLIAAFLLREGRAMLRRAA
jgi:divalent metal cation (Fe/Co/Zn/Cd) transporter